LEYLEWLAVGWWLWGGVLMASTFGLLPRWELRMTDFMGMVMGMDECSFFMRLLTMAADDLRGYYLLEGLPPSSLLIV
jgi:hypothetical protein